MTPTTSRQPGAPRLCPSLELPRFGYKVIGESGLGDEHLIITENRARAIKYARALASQDFRSVRVACGVKVFDLQQLEELP